MRPRAALGASRAASGAFQRFQSRLGGRFRGRLCCGHRRQAPKKGRGIDGTGFTINVCGLEYSLNNYMTRQSAENSGQRPEEIPGEIRVSVRGLVEFLLRSGDIDNRYHGSSEGAMQEGSRIHRMIQKRMGAEYQAEVPLKYTLQTKAYRLVVEGRADGIIHQDGRVVIDEIKGTYRDLARMREPVLLHAAQAKCYAYMYGLTEELEEVQVRLTYCNLVSEDIRYFYEDYTWEELEEWFGELIREYLRWSDFSWQWRQIRRESIQRLPFPFPYRNGQKELVVNVYNTIYHKKKLFLEAPTGVGKTISTIYPAIQAIGKGMGDKLFYLTAKTITRTVADDTMELLRRRGLRFKSVVLTAKEKICFMEETECNPEYCPYARGHYDRINAAVFDLLTSEDSFGREKIEEYAEKHQVCPFEFCLDMSLFADGIVCDYNYLFDPHIYLKRFFGEGVNGEYIFLIDEAHNLLERGREMYSAVLVKEEFLRLRKDLKETIASEISKNSRNKGIQGQLSIEMTEEMTGMPENEAPETAIDRTGLWDETEGAAGIVPGQGAPGSGKHSHGGRSVLVREGYGESLVYHLEKCNQALLALKREGGQCTQVEDIDGFVRPLNRLYEVMETYLAKQEEQLPVREQLLDFYFEVSHFLEMYELVDDNYIKYTMLCDDDSFLIKLFCVNPGENLKSCMLRGRSTILFSATFLPIQYYKKLLGGEEDDYEVYAKSVFEPARRALFLASDVTSKYSRRSQEEYFNIARYIEEIVKNRHGNYMVFCPSYSFLGTIYEIYTENFGGEGRNCIIQKEYMSETDREDFLAYFREERKDGEESILVGFCVLGGIFGEGIDLKRDSLIGAVIVGTGLPQVCFEREFLKEYFDRNGESGFDYAYRYPGMNKVLQAAGRVIRTVEDVGVVALLDERFQQFAYRKLFPREWEYYETVTVDSISKRVEHFWNEWL